MTSVMSSPNHHLSCCNIEQITGQQRYLMRTQFQRGEVSVISPCQRETDLEVLSGHNSSNLLGHRTCGYLAYVLDWWDIYPQFEVKKVRLCDQVGMVAMATHWQNIVTGFEVDTYVVLQVIRCRVGSSSAS